MKRPYVLIFLMTFLGVIAGWGVGSYLTNAGVKATLATLPAAPVVIESGYDQKTHTLSLTFSNPGGQAISIVGKGIAFKPKQGEGYEMAYVAFKQPLVVPPFSVETLQVQLKADTPLLKDGDVVATTIRYGYPLLPDVYDMTHLFVQGQPTKRKAEDKKQ